MLVRLIKKYILRFKETCIRVLNLPDSPRKIAQGVALGTTLNFLPMHFVSIPVSYLLARLLRVNAFAAVSAVILLKWAVPFFFAFNYFIGKIILGEAAPEQAEVSLRLTSPGSWIEWMGHLGYPFMLGAAVNSMSACIISYFIAKALLDCRLKKRDHTLKPIHPK